MKTWSCAHNLISCEIKAWKSSSLSGIWTMTFVLPTELLSKDMIFHIFTFILHLLPVYYELTKWSAPTWPDSLGKSSINISYIVCMASWYFCFSFYLISDWVQFSLLLRWWPQLSFCYLQTSWWDGVWISQCRSMIVVNNCVKFLDGLGKKYFRKREFVLHRLRELKPNAFLAFKLLESYIPN